MKSSARCCRRTIRNIYLFSLGAQQVSLRQSARTELSLHASSCLVERRIAPVCRFILYAGAADGSFNYVAPFRARVTRRACCVQLLCEVGGTLGVFGATRSDDALRIGTHDDGAHVVVEGIRTILLYNSIWQARIVRRPSLSRHRCRRRWRARCRMTKILRDSVHTRTMHAFGGRSVHTAASGREEAQSESGKTLHRSGVRFRPKIAPRANDCDKMCVCSRSSNAVWNCDCVCRFAFECACSISCSYYSTI